jgi:hypothetical protein
MADHGIVYTLSLGAEKRHILEARITGVPDDVKPATITDGIKGSAVAAEYSEHGFFFANRKVLPLDKLPKGTEEKNVKEIPWAALSGVATVQMNMRIPGRERSAWELAASRAGIPFRTWVRRTLAAAAGIDDPTQDDRTTA